jgi:hypothetical protein
MAAFCSKFVYWCVFRIITRIDSQCFNANVNSINFIIVEWQPFWVPVTAPLQHYFWFAVLIMIIRWNLQSSSCFDFKIYG